MNAHPQPIPDNILPGILLIDNDEAALVLLESILEDKYTVFRAMSMKEAFNVLAKEAIQLIVYDIDMSGADGPKFCRQIKSNNEYHHIPLVLLTKRKSLRTKIEVLEIGVDAYIEKTNFSTKYFRAQINSLLINRLRIRKYFASSPLAYVENSSYSKADEAFLKSMNDVIQDNLQNESLDVGLIAQSLNMSRITLYRKMHELSGLTPHKFINTCRLKKVTELLAEGSYKIYEIADMVGLGSQSSLTRIFQKQFNMSPSAYIHSRNEKSVKSNANADSDIMTFLREK
jgi:two-component system, cell cycle response regulator